MPSNRCAPVCISSNFNPCRKEDGASEEQTSTGRLGLITEIGMKALYNTVSCMRWHFNFRVDAVKYARAYLRVHVCVLMHVMYVCLFLEGPGRLLTLEDGTDRLPRNVGKLPTYTAKHPYIFM